MNNSDIIATRLRDAGVTEAYGIPGGEVLTLIKGLDDAGIRFVLCKQENAGGFMAEGAYHATGAPGVLVATIGPGVANAVNVMANALQDRVPMIFLTGCVNEVDQPSYTHQVFDHGAVLGPVCKASLKAVDGAVDVIIDKALAIAGQDPPGPVHVDVPIDVAAAEAEPHMPRSAPLIRANGFSGEAMDQARDWFKQAEKPLLIVGLEVLYQGVEHKVRTFAEQHRIPVITTYKAKGVMPEDHELSLGGAGLSPRADAALLPLVAESDCIILAGYDPIEMRAGWRNPWTEQQHVIEFTAVPNRHSMHQPSVSFVGDIGGGLDALAAENSLEENWPLQMLDGCRQKLEQQFGMGMESWGARAVVEVARRALPENTVATVDAGAHRILLSQKWHCYTPRTLLQSTGLCTMGCALPMATGYKRNRPEVPVVAFMGDGCLEMVLGELATLRDAEVPVILVVFVDRSLALIELKQRAVGYENVGVDFPGTDFAEVARALGGYGINVSSQQELEDAFADALKRDQYTLIACEISRQAYDGAF